MKRCLFLKVVVLVLFLPPSSVDAIAPKIVGPEVEIIDNNIIVNFELINVREFETIINSGIEKEIVFTVELFRVWRFWPDEFVAAKKIKKSIKYDNLREHYRASSYDGKSSTEKYFKDFATLKDWIFNIRAVNLANIKELEPGKYYIRAIVETKSVQYSPVIGFLMHFIPEIEMSLAKESPRFTVGDKR